MAPMMTPRKLTPKHFPEVYSGKFLSKVLFTVRGVLFPKETSRVKSFVPI